MANEVIIRLQATHKTYRHTNNMHECVFFFFEFILTYVLNSAIATTREKKQSYYGWYFQATSKWLMLHERNRWSGAYGNMISRKCCIKIAFSRWICRSQVIHDLSVCVVLKCFCVKFWKVYMLFLFIWLIRLLAFSSENTF